MEHDEMKYSLAFLHFIKRKVVSDPVLIAAWVLAFLSMFFVHPDSTYFEYVDWRSLGILWSLMIVIQGFKENTLFEKIGEFLLKRVRCGWQLAAVLIFLCFFAAMLITNDVALITFVPFALMILRNSSREDLMIPVVVLQTVAANLGSMLTPIGNPQNLYLYGLTGMSFGEFVMTMLPLSTVSAVLLVISIFILPGKKKILTVHEHFDIMKRFGHKKQILIYTALFLLSLCVVLRFVPWYVLAIAVFVLVLIMDYNVLFRADYALLLTFIGFFIFTGNIGRIPAVCDFLRSLLGGREFGVSILTSQVISNVPAALLLSGFTKNYSALLQGVNVGGLGTLIASMASLISYKAFAVAYPSKKGRYFLAFTLINLAFLSILFLIHLL